MGAALIVIIPEGMHMWYAAVSALPDVHGDPATGHTAHHADHDDHERHGHSEHWQVGAALAAGFGLMLVIDQMSSGYGHSHGGSSSSSSGGGTSGGAGSTGGLLGDSNGSSTPAEGRNRSAMLGLMVHAAVDGVALGATAFSGGGEASTLVFVALMLHKAPAAFGLTTYLVQLGDTLRSVKQQLLIFSLAAPVCISLLTPPTVSCDLALILTGARSM